MDKMDRKLKKLSQKNSLKEDSEEKNIGKELMGDTDEEIPVNNTWVDKFLGKMLKPENTNKFINAAFILIIIMLFGVLVYSIIQIIIIFKKDESVTFYSFFRHIITIVSAIVFTVYIIQFLKKFNNKNNG